MESSYAWLDGEITRAADATVPVLTHALHYGTAIIEGIRFYKTARGPAIFRLDDHLERLLNSARIFRVSVDYTVDRLRDATIQLIRESKLASGYIRILVFYGYKHMGINPVGIPVRCLIAVWPWQDYWRRDDSSNGIRACVSSFIKHHGNSTSRQAKISGNYANSVFGRLEATENGYDESIFLDKEGYVSEASVENIFLVTRGRARTPHEVLSLKGITRETVMRLLDEAGTSVEEAYLTRDDLYIADEIWLTGTATEITPVVNIDGRQIGDGQVGSITARAIELYSKAVEGKNPHHIDWLTFI